MRPLLHDEELKYWEYKYCDGYLENWTLPICTETMDGNFKYTLKLKYTVHTYKLMHNMTGKTTRKSLRCSSRYRKYVRN